MMNFHSRAARAYRGEKVSAPVLSDEFFPKLKKLYKLPVRIDRDRVRSDPEMVKVLPEEFIRGMKKQLEKRKDRAPIDPSPTSNA